MFKFDKFLTCFRQEPLQVWTEHYIHCTNKISSDLRSSISIYLYCKFIASKIVEFFLIVYTTKTDTDTDIQLHQDHLL